MYEKLHLRDTHFETVHGLDAPGQHSSAYDLAVLSRAIIHGEPDVYHMYSQKSLTWNGITQQNRNGLLWDKTMNVDGLKTAPHLGRRVQPDRLGGGWPAPADRRGDGGGQSERPRAAGR